LARVVPNVSDAPGAGRRTPDSRTRGVVLLAAIVALLPLVLVNDYFYDVAILVAMNAIVCVGLNLLIGYAGQISLGHAAFFALGAYGSGILAARYGWPVWASVPVAVAAVGALAFVVGRPTLRLKGHYLAMATLGLGVIVSGVALVAAVWLAQNLVASPVGRALRALHGSEVAAATGGIDVVRYKLRVFVISALFAAAAGALTAHYAGFVTPSRGSFMHSVELVIMVVFGGMASTAGAVAGAAILTTLPQLLTVLKDYEMMVFGAVLIATMAFFPKGVVPTLRQRFGVVAALRRVRAGSLR